MSKTAVIIGATGLIGSYLLEELLADPGFDMVRILIRKPMELSHPRLEKKLVDFNDSDSILVALNDSHVIFCTVGTTQKKVKGDKEAYRKVDYDIPVKAARFGKMNGCETFVLVSSAGANSRSRNFYLQLKGEVEDSLKEFGLRSVHMMRPSMLLGDRKEFRAGENLAKGLMRAIAFLLPSKYKPIHGKKIAKAMVAAAKQGKEGFFVYEYDEINKLIS